MQSGQLRHRVTIQQVPATPTRDATGAEVESWENVAEVWAEVSPLSGREFFAAQQINAEISHRVRLRYRAGLSPKMRLAFGSRHFDIHEIRNLDERNRELELYCTELVHNAAAGR